MRVKIVRLASATGASFSGPDAPAIGGLSSLLRPEIVLVAVPAAVGYALSAACKMPSSADIPFRPPAWTFAVVWPILYVLLGVAWFRTAVCLGFMTIGSASYLLTTLLLGLWLVVYSCMRQTKNAVFVLLASVLSVAFNIALSGPGERLMLLPLIVWLCFATLMNAWQTAESKAKNALTA
jgi:tryptophan-rich sensory protein